MHKIATISLSVLGVTALFAVSFLGFAKINGVPLETLPAVGGWFGSEAPGRESAALPQPPAAQGPESPSSEADPSQAAASLDPVQPDPQASAADAPAPTRTRETRAGIFDVLGSDALYTHEELRALADSLRTKNREADQRWAEIER